MTFQQTSLQLMLQVIREWRANKHYTYEVKKVLTSNRTAVAGEVYLTFTAIAYVLCGDRFVPVYHSELAFQTNTLSQNPLSDNPAADAERLKRELPRFTEQFYAMVEEKRRECDGEGLLQELFID